MNKGKEILLNTTSLNYTQKYNPQGPMGYLITFNTYGTWLHGDERGSVDRHGNNIPGTSVIPPNQKLLKLKKTKLKQPPVTLTDAQRKSIKVTIQEVIKHNNWKLHALTEHIHIVLTAPKPPDPIMNSLKSWCTRRMRENGLWTSELTPWSYHGSTRYLWNERDIHDACHYVLYEQG